MAFCGSPHLATLKCQHGLVLVVVGIIVFMTVNERPDLLREIIFGIGGLFSGLVAGIGGGYGYASRRR